MKGLEDRVAAVGEKVEFCVELTEVVPTTEVVWYANGVELKPSDLWAMRADGRAYRLVLRQAPLLPQQEITFAARDAISLAKLTIISKCLMSMSMSMKRLTNIPLNLYIEFTPIFCNSEFQPGSAEPELKFWTIQGIVGS